MLLRWLTWTFGLGVLGAIGLGLWNQQTGRFDNPRAFFKELSDSAQSLTADAGEQLGFKAQPLIQKADTSQSAIRRIRTAIGCEAPVSQVQDPGSERVTYRWQDENGVTNFSDEAPTERTATQLSVNAGAEEFFVTLQAEDAVLPGHMEGYVNAGASRAYDQWRDWLGDDAIVRSHINIRLLADEEKFREMWGRADREDWRATGFYRIRSNEAVVLYSKRYQMTALGTVFHEMSHLITAWQLGPTPPWLNEGIAEYFETMEVRWQGARFHPNWNHLRLLKSQEPPSLDTLTSLQGSDWTANDAQLRYAAAWSLIAFLFDSDEGRETLKGVVSVAHEQRCGGNSVLADSLSAYPGGREALESDWLQWIREA